MRGISKAWFAGLCFSLVACSGAADDEGGAAANEQPPAATASEATPAPGEAAPEAIAPLSPDEEAAPQDGDAGAPVPAPAADAGSDGGVKQVIPLPGTGKLHAYTSSGVACAWTVNGVAKGTSTMLDVTLYVGWYSLACKRADGVTATAMVNVLQSQTTNTAMSFPAPMANGTLIAVAVGGYCAFSVNGASKGTSSQIELSIPPGTYSVTCKPTTGAAQITRSVIIKSGETAMAMFKISA